MKQYPWLRLCLFWAVVAVASTLSAQTTARDYIASAKAEYAKGDFNDAIENFTKAIELNSKDAEAYNDRGCAKNAKSDFDGAIADYNKAIELHSNYTLAYTNRGLTKHLKGDENGAIADWTKAIELDPKLALPYYNRGTSEYHAGNRDTAMADLDKAIELNPHYAFAYGNRGLVKEINGDLNGAIADFDKTIELIPGSAYVYGLLGDAKQSEGDFEAAIYDYAKSIGLDKANADYSRFYLALTLRRLQRDDGPSELAVEVKGWKDGWIKTIGIYLTGNLPETDFLAHAEQGDAKIVREHQCEAFYFVGMTHLLANETTIAQKFLGKCLATDKTDMAEFFLARAELAQLSDKQ
jgi:tetratricopeptide (TPR) repeat protein